MVGCLLVSRLPLAELCRFICVVKEVSCVFFVVGHYSVLHIYVQVLMLTVGVHGLTRSGAVDVWIRIIYVFS